MKKILFIIGLMFSLNINAALIDNPYGDISVFTGSQTGIIVSAGSENLRFEIMSANDTGYSLKYSLSGNHVYKMWLGLGQWNIERTVSDASQNWRKTSFTNSNPVPVVFMEIDFKGNYFIRASYYEHDRSDTFNQYDNTGTLVNQKTVNSKLNDTLFWIGYKFKF